jgi:hypothetical protein
VELVTDIARSRPADEGYSMNAKAIRAYPPGVLDRREYKTPNSVRPSERRAAELAISGYPDPETYLTAEGFARTCHADLQHMDLEDIDRERFRARLRWAYDPRPSLWLRDRIARLEVLAERRRKSPR